MSLSAIETRGVDGMIDYACPKCGHDRFQVTAHVAQDWLVGANGEFLETMEECSQVVHWPDDDDVWVCARCGHGNAGKAFKEETNG